MLEHFQSTDFAACKPGEPDLPRDQGQRNPPPCYSQIQR